MLVSGWEKYKQRHHKNSAESLDRIIAWVSKNDTVMANRAVEKQVKSALFFAGRKELARKISGCERGQLCGSVYCKRCRARAVAATRKRMESHCSKQFNNSTSLADKRLRFLTVLCATVNLDDGEVRNAVADARRSLNALKRRFGAVWMQGAFEFELVRLDSARGRKKISLKQLGMADNKTQVLVHFHALVDIKTYEASALKKWLQRRWRNKYQTLLKKTYTGQSIQERCDFLSRYMFKNRTRFNPTFVSVDLIEGEHFTNHDLAALVSIYDQIGSKGYSSLLLGMGKC